MITMSRSIPVNPPGANVKLTREDVWRGLEMKANNALPFVKVIKRCDVIERGENTLLRNIEINGEPFQERITLTPEKQVKFERTEGRILGTIYNDIEEVDGELMLRFSFQLRLTDSPEGGPEEEKHQQEMGDSYLDAVNSTLSAVRRMVAEQGR